MTNELLHAMKRWRYPLMGLCDYGVIWQTLFFVEKNGILYTDRRGQVFIHLIDLFAAIGKRSRSTGCSLLPRKLSWCQKVSTRHVEVLLDDDKDIISSRKPNFAQRIVAHFPAQKNAQPLELQWKKRDGQKLKTKNTRISPWIIIMVSRRHQILQLSFWEVLTPCGLMNEKDR